MEPTSALRYLTSSIERHSLLLPTVDMANSHIPITYNVVRPDHKTKLDERQYVKERLALAYRVLAHERICKLASTLCWISDSPRRRRSFGSLD